jgi:hypothetical protein
VCVEHLKRRVSRVPVGGVEVAVGQHGSLLAPMEGA